MIRRPPRSTLTDTLFPDTTLPISRTSHVSARASAASPKSPTDQDSPLTDYVDSYYARTRADDLRREPLDGSVTAEVAVIGGGMAGLATALGLAERGRRVRSEEHTSELQSLMRISYAVFCLKKKKESKYTPLNNTSTTAVQPQ